jgi:omega-6 fatty acid desaturase (delta-12 desaturase)
MDPNPDLPDIGWAELKQILNRYQQPNTWRSVWQLANTLLPNLLLLVLMYFSLQVSYWLTLALSIPTAGFMARTFIIFHDCGHGSFFKSRQANAVTGIICGILTLTPYYYWRHSHAIHHATAGDLDRRGTGDVMTLTLQEYQSLSRPRQWFYGFVRHPLVMFTFGAFLVFTVGHRFYKPGTGKQERWSVHYTNLILAAILVGVIYWIGWKAYLMIHIPVLFFMCSAGVWLFYVQHNFEGTYWERNEKWDFFKAGFQGSSFYKLPAVLQWFTGNIGFHHIHHLNSRIPNYRLPRCYRENPVFHVRPLTLLSSLRSARLRLWDEQNRRMVGFEALRGELSVER